MSTEAPFLTAHWRHLVMLNYEVDSSVLEPFVPAGSELDLWHGEALISLVGFRFLHTRLKGWAIPFHQNFPEVNLRFYVRRAAADGWRRGVVFLKEIVPKLAVTWVANRIYHENYVTLPMSHRVQVPGSATDRTGRAEYRWQHARNEFQLSADFHGLPQPLIAGSEAEFITEHYWGYTKQPNGTTREYRVDHPTWRVWAADRAEFVGNTAQIYGSEFADVLKRPPCSALVAEGSAVTVYSGNGLPLVSGASQMMPSPTR